VRKLNERDVKIMVLVKCESQGEAENILRNGLKLHGSQVFLDKDLTLEKQANKMALLELKKFSSGHSQGNKSKSPKRQY